MSVGMIAAVSAVLIDSIVTLFVGWKLSHTAREQIAKGVEDVIANAPAIIAESLANNGSDDA